MSPEIFKSLSAADQFRFIEDELSDLIENQGELDLYTLFKSVILDGSINSNVRKTFLATVTNCVLLNKIKIRHALTILIDEWNNNSDIFLEVQRLKDLYYYYSEEKDIVENIFQIGLSDVEGEISSECAFNLGQIFFQESFSKTDKKEVIENLTKAGHYFHQTEQIIENRIDAKFFKSCTLTMMDIVNHRWPGVENNLAIMAQCFYEQEAFSFHWLNNPYYIGFYRILCSLNRTVHESPENWLDIREGLQRLFVQYSEIANQQLKNRLNKSISYSPFISFINKEILDPYYVLNLSPILAKIDIRLSELDKLSDEYQFLSHTKSLFAEDSKKKIDYPLRQTLLNIFPHRNADLIDKAVEKIKKTSNPTTMLSAFAELEKPTFDNFLDRLVNICLRMQGNRIYRGNFGENDRNTFIASMMESSQQFIVKDQPRWSVSHAGKDAGEIDIFIYEKDGTPYSIIEGINLDSIDSEYLGLHLIKILNYDTSGFQNNFILVYSTAKQFDKFCSRYKTFIDSFSYPYILDTSITLTIYPYTDLKLFKGSHRRNDMDVFLYHLLINLL